MIAVRRARRRVNDALDAGIACAHQQIEKSRGIGGVRRQRVFDRARNGAERGLVQHDVDAAACVAARLQVHDVRFDESMPAPGCGTDRNFYLVEVGAMSGCKIVEANDVLIELQQRLDEMRADESRTARDEPRQRPRRKPVGDDIQRRSRRYRDQGGHYSLHTSMPRARSAV